MEDFKEWYLGLFQKFSSLSEEKQNSRIGIDFMHCLLGCANLLIKYSSDDGMSNCIYNSLLALERKLNELNRV